MPLLRPTLRLWPARYRRYEVSRSVHAGTAGGRAFRLSLHRLHEVKRFLPPSLHDGSKHVWVGTFPSSKGNLSLLSGGGRVTEGEGTLLSKFTVCVSRHGGQRDQALWTQFAHELVMQSDCP
eukprot:scaffold938_cov334-Pavlova_lutheri.AAC.20